MIFGFSLSGIIMDLRAVINIDNPVDLRCVESGEGWVVNSVSVSKTQELTPLGIIELRFDSLRVD